MKNIASKGGQASHEGGFASMDPQKQVCITRSLFAHSTNFKLSVRLLRRAVRPLLDLLRKVVRKLKRLVVRVVFSRRYSHFKRQEIIHSFSVCSSMNNNDRLI